jgi:hypothetical protein
MEDPGKKLGQYTSMPGDVHALSVSTVPQLDGKIRIQTHINALTMP